MHPNGRTVSLFVCALVLSASLFGQGPGSCGFHLDVRANLTSTHSAVADMAGAPGAAAPLPPGFPGNPYAAFATPGSPMALVVSGNSLAYGPGPLGPGSCLSMFFAMGAAPVPLFLGPPFIPTCGGGAHMIQILPVLATIFDSCGFLAPAPPFGFFDGGTGRFTFTGTYPAFAPPVVSFQAAGVTPGGAIWITNAVTVFGAPNPAEVPVPFPVVCGGFPPLDDGQSLGLPMPPGFAFYGAPVPPGTMDMDTNGFLDFVPGAPTAGGCDTAGSSGDFGCAPVTVTARARIDANHADFDFGVPLAPPFVPGMTMEFRPPSPGAPEAWTYRWKNAPAFGLAPGSAGLSTSDFCVELQGPTWGGPPNRIVVVRSWLTTVDQVGIGGGVGPPYGPAFAGPPSTCAAGAGGIAFMGTFAPPGGLPYFAGPFGVIHMDTAAGSTALFNSAALFTPAGLGYTLTCY